MKEKVERFIRDISSEIARLHYNRVIIDRSIAHLKKTLDVIRGSRMEDVVKFLEIHDNENIET